MQPGALRSSGPPIDERLIRGMGIKQYGSVAATLLYGQTYAFALGGAVDLPIAHRHEDDSQDSQQEQGGKGAKGGVWADHVCDNSRFDRRLKCVSL